MAYAMDNSRDILDDLIYDGIYRDDGIAVLYLEGRKQQAR
jgi:hypothetical protein